MWNTDVNLLAVLAATVANMVLGSIWYSPAVFGKQWAELVGRKLEDIDSSARGKALGGMFVAALITAYVVGLFIANVGGPGALDGVLVALVAYVGLIATANLAGILFEGRPFKLYLLNTAYGLIGFAVTGFILGIWR